MSLLPLETPSPSLFSSWPANLLSLSMCQLAMLSSSSRCCWRFVASSWRWLSAQLLQLLSSTKWSSLILLPTHWQRAERENSPVSVARAFASSAAICQQMAANFSQSARVDTYSPTSLPPPCLLSCWPASLLARSSLCGHNVQLLAICGQRCICSLCV